MSISIWLLVGFVSAIFLYWTTYYLLWDYTPDDLKAFASKFGLADVLALGTLFGPFTTVALLIDVVMLWLVAVIWLLERFVPDDDESDPSP